MAGKFSEASQYTAAGPDPADAEVQREPVGDPEIVLKERVIRGVARPDPVVERVDVGAGKGARDSEQELGEGLLHALFQTSSTDHGAVPRQVSRMAVARSSEAFSGKGVTITAEGVSKMRQVVLGYREPFILGITVLE